MCSSKSRCRLVTYARGRAHDTARPHFIRAPHRQPFCIMESKLERVKVANKSHSVRLSRCGMHPVILVDLSPTSTFNPSSTCLKCLNGYFLSSFSDNLASSLSELLSSLSSV